MNENYQWNFTFYYRSIYLSSHRLSPRGRQSDQTHPECPHLRFVPLISQHTCFLSPLPSSNGLLPTAEAVGSSSFAVRRSDHCFLPETDFLPVLSTQRPLLRREFSDHYYCSVSICLYYYLCYILYVLIGQLNNGIIHLNERMILCASTCQRPVLRGDFALSGSASGCRPAQQVFGSLCNVF